MRLGVLLPLIALATLGLSGCYSTTPPTVNRNSSSGSSHASRSNRRHGEPNRQFSTGSASQPSDLEESTSDSDDPDDEPDAFDDDVTVGSVAVAKRTAANHPLDSLSQSELERRLKEAPGTLGSVSLGRPNAGSLFNGVKMPENDAWHLVDPSHAYGTEEAVGALGRALRAVFERFPDTSPVAIGHLSAKHGGPLKPHRSHQSGRDVDVGLYYNGGTSTWYARATPSTLDLKRTAYLIRTLVEDGYVEMVLIDKALHEPLREFALAEGWDSLFVDSLFSSKGGRFAVVRHAPGHATHLHIRFRSPMAQRSGELLASLLVQHHVASLPPKTVTHVARNGDTLAKLAARYGTTMHEIRVQNGMKNTQLVAGRSYRIPASSPTNNGARQVSSASPNTRSTATRRQ